MPGHDCGAKAGAHSHKRPTIKTFFVDKPYLPIPFKRIPPEVSFVHQSVRNRSALRKRGVGETELP